MNLSREADKVYVVDDKNLENFLVEPYAKVLIALIKEYNPRSSAWRHNDRKNPDALCCGKGKDWFNRRRSP